ncbi:hypothetical protein [Acinetobacter modestus]|uniref:hypothetical protein n=1 Tax=Acinetobacter modestus TaxID=1776740 RepID=UPI001F4B4D87|nr:hypothetical protein [Acinetobacter modestus]MCH7333463.1 hypothetical protein [Acinetobacter modestus]
MKITEQLLSTWGACSDGKHTFTSKFPEGAEYAAVIEACDEDGHQDYRDWIFTRAFQHLEAKEVVEAETVLLPKVIAKGLEPLASLDQETKSTDTISKDSEARLAASGDDSRLAASGDDSQLAASGDDSQLAASGNDSRLAASGYYSQLAASGNRSQLAASGNHSRLAASGNRSQLAASGNHSRLAASGKNSIIACSGIGSTFSLAEGGCAAVPYSDEKEKVRFAVAYVGENVEADTWYQVNAQGEFIKVEE